MDTYIHKVLSSLKQTYPDPHPFLDVKNPLESLVATILSAQCTDQRVNIVIKDLFLKYTSVEDYANARPEVLEQDIRTTGFFRSKAKSIIDSAKIIVGKHGGVVPNTMDELLELPGVGRKTANIVLSNGFGIDVGIPVDTHVKRVSYRIGFTKNRDPDKIEQDLLMIVAKGEYSHFAYAAIRLGREHCRAPVPVCSKCFLRNICKKVAVRKSK
jgi:endonuclease-3